METPQPLLSDGEKSDILALGRRIEDHIAESWQVILRTRQDRLLDV